MHPLLYLPGSLAIGIWDALTSPAEGRSWQMRFITALLPAMFAKRYLLSLDNDQLLQRCLERSKAYPSPPATPQGVKLSDVTAHLSDLPRDHRGEWQFYLIEPSDPTQNRSRRGQPFMLYLHGGAYVSTAQPSHFKLVYDVCQRTGATILLPAYPRPPKDNVAHRDVIEPLVKLCENLRASTTPASADDGEAGRIYALARAARNFTISGDSAGGGLAFALTMLLFREGKQNLLPDTLILNAPWLDVSLDDPEIAERYDQLDPWLCLPVVKLAGKLWTGPGASLESTLVSPLYVSDNELEGLRDTKMHVAIFQGEADLTCCDTRKLVARLRKAGMDDLEYHYKARVPHVYPLLPAWIPEAAEARRQYASLVGASAGSG